MKKRWMSGILAGVVLFTALGCACRKETARTAESTGEAPVQTQPPDTRGQEVSGGIPVPEQLVQGTLTNTIAEDNAGIYWCGRDCVWRCNKRTGKRDKLCDAEEPGRLLMQKGMLYVSARLGENNIIYRVSPDTGKKDILADFPQQQLQMAGIYDFYIQNDDVWIISGLFLYRYDKNSHSLIQDKAVATSMDVYHGVGEFLYYIPHSEKTFTVYRYHLRKHTKQVVLGQDVSKPRRDIIHDFVLLDDSMYYYQRMPRGLYEYRDGKSRLLDDGEILNLCVYQDKVYYVMFDEFGGQHSGLACYDPKTGETETAAILKNYVWKSGMALVNGYAYYEVGETYYHDERSGWSVDDAYNYITAVPLEHRKRTPFQ